MRAMRPLLQAMFLGASVTLFACHSNDPAECPSGKRTTQPTSDFADIGYPDGAVACTVGSLSTPQIFYNGVETQEAAAAKLTTFMQTKGYQAKPQAVAKSDLTEAESGHTIPTRLVFVKDGAKVRYYVTLSQTRSGHAVEVGWTRVDCAAKPSRFECGL